MTRPKLVEVVPLGFYSSLELARWAAVAHEEVVRLAVTRAAFLLNTRGDYWARLAQHFQPRLFREESGGLAREGYVLSREGLLHVLHDLPDSPRVQKLREIAGRVMFSHILGGMADKLAAAFDQPPQPEPQGTQP